MSPREVLGVGIRLIGIYFIASGMADGILGLARVIGIEMGASSNAARDFVFLGTNLLVGMLFVASGKELAIAAYRGGDSDKP